MKNILQSSRILINFLAGPAGKDHHLVEGWEANQVWAWLMTRPYRAYLSEEKFKRVDGKTLLELQKKPEVFALLVDRPDVRFMLEMDLGQLESKSGKDLNLRWRSKFNFFRNCSIEEKIRRSRG